MDAAPSSPPPASPPSSVLQAWPRSAQLALAFLLGIAAALLAVQSFGAWHWRSRPSDLQRYRINLNRADRAELLQLPGVGETLASRIEDHRRKTGGFRSVEQLAEVPGFGPARLEQLREWVCVDDPEEDRAGNATVVTRSAAKPSTGDGTTTAASAYGAKKVANLKEPININQASAEEMQRVLPGIGPTLARRIVEERQKAPFKSVEDLRRVHGIGAKTLERLRPHVVVEDRLARVPPAE